MFFEVINHYIAIATKYEVIGVSGDVAESISFAFVEEALVVDGVRIGSGDQSLRQMELEL